MRVEALGSYGVESSLVAAVKARYGDDLFEVQARAVAQHGLLTGRNLVVSAPTGSGKTLIGELAALHRIGAGHKAVMVVPTRSLAEEKWLSLAEAYGPLGVRTVLATAERRGMDSRIARGDFDLLVTVPEKLLTFANGRAPAWLTGGALIVDELQLLSDPERGPVIEELLMHSREPDAKVQIICLSAVLGDSRALGAWLDAEVLRSALRPVELRTGVLLGGEFHYREHNSGLTGVERLTAGSLPEPDPMAPMFDAHEDTLSSLLDELHQRGETALVFLRDRMASFRLAQSLAQRWPLDPAGNALRELGDVEATRAGEILAETLPHGVAVHNADLTLELRALVERAARRGEARVICATSTLAMGVNLAVDNVIIDAERWMTEADGEHHLAPVSQAEVENMGGRAGRIQPGAETPRAGRAILIADTEVERGALVASYIHPRQENIEPQFHGPRLFDAACRWVARSERTPASALARLTTDTLTCRLLTEQVCAAEDLAARLESEGLATREGNDIVPTRRLTVVGRLGLPLPVVDRLANSAQGLLEGPDDRLRTLCALCRAALPIVPIYVSPTEGEARPFTRALVARLYDDGEEGGGAAAVPEEVDEAAAKLALLADDWLGEDPTLMIENRYRTLAGTIVRLMRDLARAVRGAAMTVEEPGPLGEALCARLEALADGLLLGCGAACGGLADLAASGLARDHVRNLVSAGITSREELLATDGSALADIVPAPVAARLLRAARAQRPRTRDSLFAETQQAEGIAPSRPAAPPRLVFGEKGVVSIDGIDTHLPRNQLALLQALARKPGRCVPYRDLFDALSGTREPTPDRVRDLKNRLLRHLSRSCGATASALIVTLPGRGLMLDLAREAIAAPRPRGSD